LFVLTNLLLSSCAQKHGMTTSKIKIVSGNLQVLLDSKLNNELVLFGKSTDGKSFTKSITSDTVDLIVQMMIFQSLGLLRQL